MKGQVLDKGVELAMAIVVIVFVIGAGAIGLGAFATGQTGTPLAIINNGSSGLLNMSIQMPSVGTMAGVAVLLLVLFGAFYMFLGNRK